MPGERRGSLLGNGLAALAATVMCGGADASAAEETVGRPAPILARETFSGDWHGLRSALRAAGVDFTLQYIGEGFRVVSGGIHARGSYEGRLEFSADADLAKFMGWSGASAHATLFNIHNGGWNVADNVGSIADPGNIDAVPTTRLFTLWLQQDFNERVSLRIGQLAADDEFFTSETAGGLINGTFGWPGIVAANIASGGPAYPLATPGVRLQVNPTDAVSALVGVFSGDPAGRNCSMDPQVCNPRGTTFSFAGGALWMGELQYRVNQGEGSTGLPGAYKLGVWHATADYPDQHFGIDAIRASVSLGVDPTAAPVQHAGNWGLYAIADQMVWRQGARSASAFVRAGVVPADRNPVSWYVDGGAGVTGLLPGRPADVLTFGVAYAGISRDAAAADRDALAANGPPSFVRDYELVFEVSYALMIAPWWIVQPDFQYTVHPGGNIAHPDDPARTIGNAVAAGVRSTITF